jgi:hypothetical protein
MKGACWDCTLGALTGWTAGGGVCGGGDTELEPNGLIPVFATKLAWPVSAVGAGCCWGGGG